MSELKVEKKSYVDSNGKVISELPNIITGPKAKDLYKSYNHIEDDYWTNGKKILKVILFFFCSLS